MESLCVARQLMAGFKSPVFQIPGSGHDVLHFDNIFPGYI